MRARRYPQVFQVVARYPGRSALTVLGLSIGIASFIAMMSFGAGARASVLSQFEVLGVNLIKVTTLPAQLLQGRTAHPLSDADVAALEREATTAARVLPVARRQLDVAFEGVHHATQAYGAEPGYAHLHQWPVVSGGIFDAADVLGREKVCVLGAQPKRKLFGHEDPLGRTITVGGTLACRVVGVLADKGHSTAGVDLDDIVLLPVSTFKAYLAEQDGYYYIEVEPQGPWLLEPAKAEVTSILRRTHALGPLDVDDFTVSSPLEVVRAVDRTTRILGALLTGIAAISLLVGGIGIMNIQLVSVAERTTEIGIRAAIGASPRQILTQFLLEAALLGLIGATLGVISGYGVASVVADKMGWPRAISAVQIAGAALFGVMVGLIFGYVPARLASRLEPIVALGRE